MDHWDLFSSKMKSYDNLTLRFITGFGFWAHFAFFWFDAASAGSMRHPQSPSFYDRAVSEDRCFRALLEPPSGPTVVFCESWMPSASRPCEGEVVAAADGSWSDLGWVLQSFLKERCDPPTPPCSLEEPPLSEVFGILKQSFKLFASPQNTKEFTLSFPVPYIFGTRGRSLARLVKPLTINSQKFGRFFWRS